MELFHGSPNKLGSLKSPIETGNIRKGEEGRKELLDVVFFTTSQGEASNYAGKNGYIYIVEVNEPQQLCTIPVQNKNNKEKIRSKSIWVAYPNQTKIIRVIHPNGLIKKPFEDKLMIGS